MKQTTSHLSQTVWKYARENELSREAFLEYLKSQAIFKNIENHLEFHFKNSELLFEALTHSSFVNEFPQLKMSSYERLEFLGDSLVDFFVSEELHRRFPDCNQGELSRLRSALVNEQSLYELSSRHHLGEGLLFGKAEILSAGWKKESILSDIVESLLAAVYLDQGMDKAKQVFTSLLKGSDDFFSLFKLEEFDAKSRLQEKTMALYKALPEYRSLEQSDGTYKVELFICSHFIASVFAESKKKGEMKVAARALKEKRYVLKE